VSFYTKTIQRLGVVGVRYCQGFYTMDEVEVTWEPNMTQLESVYSTILMKHGEATGIDMLWRISQNVVKGRGRRGLVHFMSDHFNTQNYMSPKTTYTSNLLFFDLPSDYSHSQGNNMSKHFSTFCSQLILAETLLRNLIQLEKVYKCIMIQLTFAYMPSTSL